MQKQDLLTAAGLYALHHVESLGNQAAVVNGQHIFVATTGTAGHDVGIALAAVGAILDLGLLAWPSLGLGMDLGDDESTL